MISTRLLLLFFAVTSAAALSAGMLWATRPLLQRYTLARPNARSSHQTPTPQGAGVALVPSTLLIAAACSAMLDIAPPLELFAATLLLAFIGLVDDIKSAPVLPRLLIQTAAISMVLSLAPPDLRLVAACPVGVERTLLLLAALWFVNLVNFMDGLDLMTVSEVVPITGALLVLGILGEYPASATIVAAALCGTMLGFYPFNRPVAKVFLGDVGSLPTGLLLGWCLLQLAWQHQIIAATLLPLYYLLDATITLLRRISRRERFWVAHRTHFYQRATDNGFTVYDVTGEVFTLNIALGCLAVVSTKGSSVQGVVLLAAGVAAVSFVLYRFSRQRSLEA